MNTMRERAKEHFPTVLLTLLSIVQALALELLWSHLQEAEYLYILSPTAVALWLQILATFFGIVLIWVVYASNVMRFRWVPATSDSVYPFLIGVIEFMLIETLSTENVGLWFGFMAAVFGLMYWIAHITMKRARQDEDNAVFFRGVAPARLSDFYAEIATVTVLATLGSYLHLSGTRGALLILSLAAVNGVLIWQFFVAAHFWKRSVGEQDQLGEEDMVYREVSRADQVSSAADRDL